MLHVSSWPAFAEGLLLLGLGLVFQHAQLLSL
jgi:hypothetical protein